MACVLVEACMSPSPLLWAASCLDCGIDFVLDNTRSSFAGYSVGNRTSPRVASVFDDKGDLVLPSWKFVRDLFC